MQTKLTVRLDKSLIDKAKGSVLDVDIKINNLLIKKW